MIVALHALERCAQPNHASCIYPVYDLFNAVRFWIHTRFNITRGESMKPRGNFLGKRCIGQ